MARYFFFLIILFSQNLLAQSYTLTFDNPKFTRNLQLENTHIYKDPHGNPSIKLQTNNYYTAQSNILYLDFEQSHSHLLSDVSGHYKIKNSNYIVNEFSIFGKRAALFNRNENLITIESPDFLHPKNKYIDDFTIEFWIKPVFFYRHNSIIKKYNMIDGFRQGLEVYIKDKKLHFSCYNLFNDAKSRKRSLDLVSRSTMERNKWSQILLSYKAVSGHLKLLINGTEEDATFAKDNQSVWIANINPLDRSPMQIGSSYSGYLDELRISSQYYSEDVKSDYHFSLYPSLRYNTSSLKSSQAVGHVASAVLPIMDNKQISRARLRFQTGEPADTNINIWIRYSDQEFLADVNSNYPEWKLINNNQYHFLPSARFYQWKAQLKADPAGKYSPSIMAVDVQYDPDRPLPTPESFQIVKELSNDQGICLEWDDTSSIEVANRGGYQIHIGLQSGEFITSLPVAFQAEQLHRASSNNFPLTESEKLQKERYPDIFHKRFKRKVRLFLTNQMLTDFQFKTGRPVPLLESNRLYYLAISTYRDKFNYSSLSDIKSFYLRPAF